MSRWITSLKCSLIALVQNDVLIPWVHFDPGRRRFYRSYAIDYLLLCKLHVKAVYRWPTIMTLNIDQTKHWPLSFDYFYRGHTSPYSVCMCATPLHNSEDRPSSY